MIEFRLLNQAGLKQFIESEEYKSLKNLPITKHRAISHIHNPRADKDDVLLIMAYIENEMVGYLGILPDRLFLSNENSYKFGWLSCLWVDVATRGKGIGEQLIKKSLMLWDNKIMSADFVPSTKKIYDKTEAFDQPFTISGIRLYIRMDLQTILPPKKPIFQNIKIILKIGDTLINYFLDVRFLIRKNELPPYKIEFINKLDDETGQFISRFDEDQLFKRGIHELNWILGYPWILSSTNKDRDSLRYHFSSIDKSFDYYCLKLCNGQNELIAFLIFTKRNRILKLPYCFMNKEVLPAVVQIIEFYILQWKINSFTTFHPDIVAYFTSHKTISIYKKQIERSYMISKTISYALKDLKFNIQDGDADIVFT